VSRASDHRGGIFVVDDDKDIRESLLQVLEDEGYTAHGASNGVEALVLLRDLVVAARRPCVILLDLMMPVMDGWAFRAEQLGDPQLAPIPVVVLTADGHAREKAARLSACAGLAKPIGLAQLLAAVEPHCVGE
jgi:CheY-like chemotaxis protein